MSNQKTKSELLKVRVLKVAHKLLEDFEADIEGGIANGTYEEIDNIENFKFIEEAKQLFDEFEKHQPAIYVFLEGGNIQGASATCNIDFNLFDKDNYKAGGDSQTPEEWSNQIEAMTAKNEIKGIY